MNSIIIIVSVLAGLILLTKIANVPMINTEEPIIEEIEIAEDVTAWPAIMYPIKTPEPALLTKVKDFLFNDRTDEKKYVKGIYTCGHFSRDLAANASKENLDIGVIFLGIDPDLEGYDNHAVNYIMIEDKMYIIRPQKDTIEHWDDCVYQSTYKYYKLYPDGYSAPSRYRRLSGINETSDIR